MPRKIIQKLMPDAAKFKQHSGLRWISGSLSNPLVWHLNRRSVAGAVAVGLFIGWQPIPMQMVVAAILALLLHVNLPISVLLVWISNPVTFPALLYAAYQTGTRLLGLSPEPFGFEPTLEWLWEWLLVTWQPVFLGCLFLGALSGVIGFFATRLLWRIALVRRWQERRARKVAAKLS